MATTTKSDIDALLKDFYLEPARSSLNTSHPLLELIESKGSEAFSGRKVTMVTTVSRGVGVGSHGESGDLPGAGGDVDVNHEVEAKSLNARFALTGTAIASATGSRGAFVDIVKRRMESTVENCKDALLRQLHGNTISGNNNTGILTQVNGAVAGVTTVVCDSTRFIKQGMTLAIGTAGQLTGGTADYRTVASVTSSTQFEVDSNLTAADNDIICTATTSAAAENIGYTNELTGLAQIVSKQNVLQALSGVTYPAWNAYVSDNGGVLRPLSLALMGQVYDNIHDESGLEPDMLLCHNSVKREYIDLLIGDVRYVALQLKGGHTALSFAHGSKELPLFSDKYARYNAMYFLNQRNLKLFKLQNWGWMDRDGSVVSRIQGKDGYEGTFGIKAQLGTTQRNAHGVLTDLIATV